MSDRKSLKDNKLKVDIFVPLDACSCVWDHFMNQVFEVLTPYIKYINQDTKNSNSEEARKLKILGSSVVIDGKKVFNSSQALKQQLPDLLKEKGLI